jgi:hypothetical protein
MSHSPNDYGLVIGINNYPLWNNGAKSLQGSVKDAQDFRDWLIDAAGGGLPTDNVKLILSSDAPLGPRQYAIDDAFREIRELSEKKVRRRFYFYFSGHGHSRAGSFQQQSLCLANWSPIDPGAALHLESYIKTSIGCLKFSEAIFLLDCCRVRAFVPLGHGSELECGTPDSKNRYSAVLFGSDEFEPTYEGEVNEEIRGYFTAGLLKVLKQGTIELGDLLKRLRVIVPELAKPKAQTVRAIPADTEIYFGPPHRKPPEPVFVTADGTEVRISVTSNLTGANSSKDRARPPRVGDISILRDDLLVARGVGSLQTKLRPGRYQVRIDHAEASATHDIEVGYKNLEPPPFELPRRASATLLSSTIDKHESLTDPVVAASRWDSSNGGQAAFISLRPQRLGERTNIAGWLYLGGRSIPPLPIQDETSLYVLPPGMAELCYDSSDGHTVILPFPIVKDWDTHIFILTSEGRPLLATASVSMRPAGAGFDPSDALIDAYERAIADLVTGGPGPDPATLDSLLWGKYRNPLFGLLGAQFLIRKLRSDAEPDPYDLDRLSVVAENLGTLLGDAAPDVVALRLWKELITNTKPTERFHGDVPLFNVSFQAYIEATAASDRSPSAHLDEVALGLEANSSWAVWRRDRTIEQSQASYFDSTSRISIQSASFPKLNVIEELWRGRGYDVESTDHESHRKLFATRAEFDNSDLALQTDLILRIPHWVVQYMRDAIGQSVRTGQPLDFARLVRRTMLPLNILSTAKTIAEQVAADSREQIRPAGEAGLLVATETETDPAGEAKPSGTAQEAKPSEDDDDSNMTTGTAG